MLKNAQTININRFVENVEKCLKCQKIKQITVEYFKHFCLIV